MSGRRWRRNSEKHPSCVADGLAAAELTALQADDDRMRPELRAPHLERNARARARLLENDRDAAASQNAPLRPNRLVLEERGQREHLTSFFERQVGKIQKVSLRHRSS